MKYINTEITVDDLITKLNEGKVNLNPPFQRNQVWKLKDRQKLVKNMLLERPIPALFLFKVAKDIKTVSYVLDGKQRLESLILYIADDRKGAAIRRPQSYFFKRPTVIAQLGFGVQAKADDPWASFSDLPPEAVRKLLDYKIAVIEVDFPDDDDEQANLLDVIQLFIDINESGRRVTRIEIVRALSQSLAKDDLFTSLFKLVGMTQPRHGGKTLFNKPVQSDYTFVMKRLRDVVRASDDSKKRIDIMWERLHELALYAKTSTHRAPAEVLKGMIAGVRNKALTQAEQKKLKGVFKFLADAYRSNPTLESSKFATDQPQFYTLVTTLLSSDLMGAITNDELALLLDRFAAIANGTSQPPNDEIAKHALSYIEATGKQTTHLNMRQQRHDALVAGVKALKAL